MTDAIARILLHAPAWDDLPPAVASREGRIAVRGDGPLPADLVRVAPQADAVTLEAAAARARLGLILVHPRTADDIGRAAAALAVAEARLDRAADTLGLAVLIGTADGLAVLARTVLPRRLVALGLDTPALIQALGLDPAAADGAPPVVVARGQVVLAAATLGLAAVERRPSARANDAAAARAAGFAALLAPPESTLA